ncbi:unknown [Clostridium sp. CAG:967]|nr:unknown [Clostridium sp. CAG:967]
MVSNRMTEGVGKKIVEALKKQSDIEIQSVVENPAPVEEEMTDNSSAIEFTSPEEPSFEEPHIESFQHEHDFSTEQEEDVPVMQQPFVMPNTMSFSQPAPSPVIEKEIFANDLEGFEIPTNVAVLKQLINQLPAGVSKQTGALIIKQTMEALGISMKSVLQEAQQVQESLNNSQRECQASIMEYRKQINVLEKQSQKFQRQYSALNDIISLFIQTNI